MVETLNQSEEGCVEGCAHSLLYGVTHPDRDLPRKETPRTETPLWTEGPHPRPSPNTVNKRAVSILWECVLIQCAANQLQLWINFCVQIQDVFRNHTKASVINARK